MHSSPPSSNSHQNLAEKRLWVYFYRLLKHSISFSFNLVQLRDAEVSSKGLLTCCWCNFAKMIILPAGRIAVVSNPEGYCRISMTSGTPWLAITRCTQSWAWVGSIHWSGRVGSVVFTLHKWSTCVVCVGHPGRYRMVAYNSKLCIQWTASSAVPVYIVLTPEIKISLTILLSYFLCRLNIRE